MSRSAIAYINLTHLRHNYRILSEKAAGARVMAVVKADAYGHGLHLVAPALLDEGCCSFAVTDAIEGAELRSILGEDADIVLLSGIFDAADAEMCRDHHLTPAITEPRQSSLLAAAGFRGKVWLKVDTGMNRLGAEDVTLLYAACVDHKIEIAGVMSHLACADEPEHPLNAQQVARFQEAAATLPTGTAKSLLNSAGLVSMSQHAFDVVRPGIALYGAEPIAEQPLGLKPVMQLCGRVMQVRDVKQGESVSYGASFTAAHDMCIATVAIGYADGLPRVLSNRGQAYAETAILPIVGRICMDYTLLDISKTDISTGSEIEFWGLNMLANTVAQTCGTISYELFTGVGQRTIRQAIE